MTRYRVEIYSKDFLLRSFSEVSSKNLNIDYMVLGTSTVKLPHIVEAYEGDFITLKIDGVEKYAGIVVSSSYQESSTTITVRSFMSLLDLDVMIDISRLEVEALEDIFAEKLRQLYAGADTTQAITGFTVVVNNQTIGTNIGENLIYNFHDLAIYAFKKYGIIFRFALNVAGQSLTCTIEHLDGSVKTIKASVGDVKECVIDVKTIEADYNKVTYYNEEDLTESVSYYLHTDGTIDSDPSYDRFEPVNAVEDTCSPDTDPDDPKTFQQVAYEDALSTLAATEYENEINVTIKADSNLIDIGQIGQIYRVIGYNGVVYTSILTGFTEINPKYITLKLGYVRTDLTSILKMQRRGKR